MLPFSSSPEPPQVTEPAASPSSWLLRIQALLLIILSSVTALALFSYKPLELGACWLRPQAVAQQVEPACTNILGWFGMYLAGFYTYLFGAVAWWLACLLFLMGLRRLISPLKPWRKQWICVLLLVIFGCAMLSLQDLWLQDWTAHMGLSSTGGVLGYLTGSCLLGQLMGAYLACGLLLAAHAVTLTFLADSNPVEPFVIAGQDCATWWRRWKQHRETQKIWKKAAKANPNPSPDAPDGGKSFGKLGFWQQQQRAYAREQEEDLPNDQNSQFHYSKKPATTPNAASEQEGNPAPFPPAAAATKARSPRRLSKTKSTQDSTAQAEAKLEAKPEAEPKKASQPTPASLRKPASKTSTGTKAKASSKATFTHPDDYPLPALDHLHFIPECEEDEQEAQQEMASMQMSIIETLQSFDIDVEAGDITRGPSITRYEIYPPRGLRVNRITNLKKDLMLATSSASINILAPIPGKNTVGIELPNVKKTPVFLRELMEEGNFFDKKYRIPVALGKDVYGNTVIGDLAAMPHTLVAGTTGSGKSVCINSMIISMLYKFSPQELKLILIDPKVVEMQPYRKLPHLACPVVTDPGRVIGALRWAVNEMEHRYHLFSKMGVRNFEDFNNRPEGYMPEEDEEVDFFNTNEEVDYDKIEAMASEIERQADDELDLGLEEEEEDYDTDVIPAKLPYIVIIIDELADLMMMVKEDIENYIGRLTQKARAAGIHLVVATQTPRSTVLTGTIKANIPSRIAFKVSSPLDSRIILDTDGAENLLGQGDFLFIPPGGLSKMMRAQGAFVSDEEVNAVVKHCASHAKQQFVKGATTELEKSDGGEATATNGGRLGTKDMSAEDSELYTRCLNLIVTERKASTSLLQRRFSIGYSRAAKIMDMLEEKGIISSPRGATRAREVLIDPVE